MKLKKGQVKTQTNCRHKFVIHRIVWHLSLSAVIVCILLVVFISGRLDWADQYCSGKVEG